MRVLVLGGGGREHALCWALARAPSVDAVLCAPGNVGIAEVAELHDVDPTDTAMVRELAVREGIDLVIVGPEAPLVAGVVDSLQAADIPVFGPTSEAARIESSKVFAKDVMAAAGVPTARHWAGNDAQSARAALRDFDQPYVVKADGLAAGKGVRICVDEAEAGEALTELMIDQLMGAAGSTVLIEEFLEGPEVSVFGLCDGSDVVVLAPAQDFKRVGAGDTGPNTGGMGAYCPYPLDQAALDGLRDGVFRPVLAELAVRGASYVGVLYAGLVLAADGPKVLEFNARFGDPETQALLPRLSSDLAEVLAACAAGRLASTPAPRWDERSAVTVVLASGGYPAEYRTGKPISGLDEAAAMDGALVFHAGTRLDGDQVVTAGGRVLAVTGLADTVGQAREIAYAAADRIDFDGMQRRDDIAAAG
ncbi:MAG: phosphoribosylamine--glycine ligase [Actinomycetota bacterium]|nr:phosphoribosylamine--glycine ligase [Actinomycetota bacterium]